MKLRGGSIADGGRRRSAYSYSPILVAVWRLAPASVPAGPPLITDDPDTPGRRRWEINVSYNLELTRERVELEPSRMASSVTKVGGGLLEGLGLPDPLTLAEPPPRSSRRKSFEHELPLIDINYGVTDRDQLKIEFAVLITDPAEGSTEGGIGNLLVGYKYRILDEQNFPFSLSLYPQIELPTGARRLGLGRKPAYILPLQVARHFLDDTIFVYGEIGFVAAPEKDVDDEWFYGVAVEWSVLDEFTLLGEVNGSRTVASSASSDVVFNLGFKWEVTDHLSLLTAVGRSFHSAGPERPELFGFWGVQLTF